MRTKTTLITAILVLAVALSACGPAAVASSQAKVRSLSVTGIGQVMLTPDIAYINIGVHSESPTAADAVAANNTQTQGVISSLEKFGVDKKDIRTTNFSIWPNQQYGPDGQKTDLTYVVDNTVYVTVRDLTKLGDLLDEAVKAGANSINSIQFDVADKTEAIKQARAKAVTDAKTQAQELADSAGVKLGEVQTISFYDNVPGPLMDAFGKGGGSPQAEAAASVPVQPGQMTLTVTVNMSYEIK
jgi:uncharacterized protein YggE